MNESSPAISPAPLSNGTQSGEIDSGPVSHSIIDPTADAAWQTLVELRDSDVFHSPAWLRVLRDSYDLRPMAVMVGDESGGAESGFVFCETNGVSGARITSLPFSDFCDPLLGDPEHWSAIVSALEPRGIPLTARVLRNQDIRVDPRFRATGRARWHGLHLGPGPDALWASADESFRRAVRKAERSGVVVRPAESTSELRRFYELHLAVRKGKYRLLPQPYSFFERIWDEFMVAGQGTLWLAYHGDDVVAGILALRWKERMYYKFNASDPTALNLRPNDLLVWTVVQSGCREGVSVLDFGLSDWDQEGLARYKRKFGSIEREITSVVFEPADFADVRDQRLGPLLTSLTEVFTDPAMPDQLTEEAAGIMYRMFV